MGYLVFACLSLQRVEYKADSPISRNFRALIENFKENPSVFFETEVLITPQWPECN